MNLTLFLTGAVFGEYTRLYNNVFELERKIGKQADWILSVGSFGIFPDPAKADRASKKRGIGEFAEWYLQKEMPRQTLTISGINEDHDWLSKRIDLQLIQNLHYLVNGNKTYIGNIDKQVSVIGLGKTYSPKFFNSNINFNRFYNKTQIDRAISNKSCDILMFHDGAPGVKYGSKLSITPESLYYSVARLNPKLIIHGHLNHSMKGNTYRGISLIGLANHEIVPVEYDGDKFTEIKV